MSKGPAVYDRRAFYFTRTVLVIFKSYCFKVAIDHIIFNTCYPYYHEKP